MPAGSLLRPNVAGGGSYCLSLADNQQEPSINMENDRSGGPATFKVWVGYLKEEVLSPS